MSELSENEIKQALAGLKDPSKPGSILDNNRVSGFVIRGGNIGFSIEISPSEASLFEAIRLEAETLARAIPGVLSATVALTAHSETPSPSPKAPEQNDGNAQKRAPNQEVPPVLQKIKRVIAVASGKGGVGKSTIALNLALALSRSGLKTGLLDADIYGPSLPALLNVTDKPEVNDKKKLLPIERHGLYTMSIGYMVPPEQAMIWRGPMVQSALVQLLNDVDWPELDILVMDLPPGTGDIQLTISQRIPLDGAIVVSTPHELALADVKRALGMFKRVNTPVLGVIENMAYMDLADGTKAYPFGDGGSQDLATEMGVPFLGQFPLSPTLQSVIRDHTTIFDHADSAKLAEQFEALAKAVRA